MKKCKWICGTRLGTSVVLISWRCWKWKNLSNCTGCLGAACWLHWCALAMAIGNIGWLRSWKGSIADGRYWQSNGLLWHSLAIGKPSRLSKGKSGLWLWYQALQCSGNALQCLTMVCLGWLVLPGHVVLRSCTGLSGLRLKGQSLVSQWLMEIGQESTKARNG